MASLRKQRQQLRLLNFKSAARFILAALVTYYTVISELASARRLALRSKKLYRASADLIS